MVDILPWCVLGTKSCIFRLKSEKKSKNPLDFTEKLQICYRNVTVVHKFYNFVTYILILLTNGFLSATMTP